AGGKVCKGEALFPRIDVAKELDIIDTLTGQKKEEPKAEKKEEKKAKKEAKKEEKADDGYITFDDFAKVQLRTARVVACETVEGSEKLLKFTLDDGTDKPRTILSGIRKWYDDPAALVGRDVIFVANLKPRKMMGMLSEGMILSAEGADGDLSLLSLEHAVKGGSSIS
ncbi:MAG: methionine--tRNA ligase subunit beta, partial [Clostridia bacterium]|nr:methionine--tRNA ligase subunit beta [Clostridia bacterium]